MTAEERKKKEEETAVHNGERDFQYYGEEPENGNG